MRLWMSGFLRLAMRIQCSGGLEFVGRLVSGVEGTTYLVPPSWSICMSHDPHVTCDWRRTGMTGWGTTVPRRRRWAIHRKSSSWVLLYVYLVVQVHRSARVAQLSVGQQFAAREKYLRTKCIDRTASLWPCCGGSLRTVSVSICCVVLLIRGLPVF